MKHKEKNPLQMQLTPIGEVSSEMKTPTLRTSKTDIELREHMGKIREYHQKLKDVVCEITIFPRWEDLLDGIEGFSHILVLYWPHLIDPKRRDLRKVHPMGRKVLPKQGIFATCSPARPNPILVSAVKLVKRNGNRLVVQGLEAVDGSPVIDIKPYVQPYYGAENPTVPAWMAKVQRELEMDVKSNCSDQNYFDEN